MCGIVGYIGFRNAVPMILDGLTRLEYRGYDSAGLAVQTSQTLSLRKATGRVGELRKLIAKDPVSGQVGLGHTRWATHGPATDINSHPHFGGERDVVIVHNGVIENYEQLKNTTRENWVSFLLTNRYRSRCASARLSLTGTAEKWRSVASQTDCHQCRRTHSGETQRDLRFGNCLPRSSRFHVGCPSGESFGDWVGRRGKLHRQPMPLHCRATSTKSFIWPITNWHFLRPMVWKSLIAIMVDRISPFTHSIKSLQRWIKAIMSTSCSKRSSSNP